MGREREIVLVTNIKRERGFLYPTGTDENGCLIIYKIKAGRKKKKPENDTPAV